MAARRPWRDLAGRRPWRDLARTPAMAGSGEDAGDGGRRGRRWLTIFQHRRWSSGTAAIVGDGGAVVVGAPAPAGTAAPTRLQQRRPSGPGKETRRRRPWGRRRGAPAVGEEAKLGRAAAG
jgi:hypothetical protein